MKKTNTHIVTVRLNELEYSYLNRLVVQRMNIDDFDGYTKSDILRIALGYMIDVELWGSRTTTCNKEIAKLQQEYAKAYWEGKKDE